MTSLSYRMTNITDSTDADIPVVIVGNKSDKTEERAVTEEEASGLAQSLGYKYIETSAKDNVNVNEAFDILLDKILASAAAGGAGKGTTVIPEKSDESQNTSRCMRC